MEYTKDITYLGREMSARRHIGWAAQGRDRRAAGRGTFVPRFGRRSDTAGFGGAYGTLSCVLIYGMENGIGISKILGIVIL